MTHVVCIRARRTLQLFSEQSLTMSRCLFSRQKKDEQQFHSATYQPQCSPVEETGVPFSTVVVLQFSGSTSLFSVCLLYPSFSMTISLLYLRLSQYGLP